MKILLVDDEMRFRKLIAAQLRKEGYTIIEAGDGLNALELISIEKPDLIVLDILMPKMDGLTVYSKIKSNNKTSNIPIIILTAQDDDETLLKIKDLNIEHYLFKPFRFMELINKINSIIANKGI